MPPTPILLFADRLPPLIGGMEMHAGYFRAYFQQGGAYQLRGTITRDEQGRDGWLVGDTRTTIELPLFLKELAAFQGIVFFNSGRWIEQLHEIRAALPQARLVYRTGGNEIIQAPLTDMSGSLSSRQAFWVSQLNQNLDLLIANSEFTIKRLQKAGIRADLIQKVVGGVDAAYLFELPVPDREANAPFTIFCAARFVPYKNHQLLIQALSRLAQTALDFQVILAGSGPLQANCQQQVQALGLQARVQFMGDRTNHQVLTQLLASDLYLQLSVDQPTEVPGGRYIHAEGMGRSYLEAISAGTPVLALDQAGALGEVVSPGRGHLLSSREPDQIAAAILEMAQRRSRGPKTRAYAWETVFQSYERLWQQWA